MRHREEWIRAVNTIPSISLTTCVLLPWGREGRGDVTPPPPQHPTAQARGQNHSVIQGWMPGAGCLVLGAGCWDWMLGADKFSSFQETWGGFIPA